jgi:hypothetical protein
MSVLRELENLLQEITDQRSPQRGPQPRPSRPPAQAEPIEYLDAEIVDAEPVREDIREHVSHTMDTSDITSSSSQFGSKIGLTDERLEARIHETFDHDLSKIDDHLNADQQSDQTPGSPTAASEIAEMLRNPKSIRQAVILSEILDRPLSMR